MTELIHELYYQVDDWASQQCESSGEGKDLLARKSELEREIALRLGGGGEHLLDTLSDLNLSLEDLRSEALFRAAMQLGAEIACPGAWRADNVRPYSTSR